MNNIKKFDEFNSMNELAIWDAIKGLVGKFFGDLDKKISDKITSLGQKMQNAKTNKEKYDLFSKELNMTSQDFKNDVSNTDDIIQIRKKLKDYISKIYLLHSSAADWLKNRDIAPGVIFKDGPNKDILGWEKPELFKSNIDKALNKRLQDSPNISEEDKKKLTAKQDIDASAKEKPVEQPVATESRILKFDRFSVLNEAEVAGTTPPAGTTPAKGETDITKLEDGMAQVLTSIVSTSDDKVKVAFGMGTPAATQDQKQVVAAAATVAKAIDPNVNKNAKTSQEIVTTISQLKGRDSKKKLISIRDTLKLDKTKFPIT